MKRTVCNLAFAEDSIGSDPDTNEKTFSRMHSVYTVRKAMRDTAIIIADIHVP